MSSDLPTKPGTHLLPGSVPSCHTEKYGDSVEARAAEQFEKGLSVRKVAQELGVSKSQAHRLRMKLQIGNVPLPSVPSLDSGTADRGTVGQRSSNGDTPRESPKPTDEGAQTAGQDSRDSQTEIGTPPAGSDTERNRNCNPSGTAKPPRPRFIPWQHDRRTGIWYRLWPEDLD